MLLWHHRADVGGRDDDVVQTALKGVNAAVVGAILGATVTLAAESFVDPFTVVLAAAAFLIVLTVPDHFLDEHLWRHVARHHVPRIFAWTLGALVALHLLEDFLSLGKATEEGRWLVLLLACLVGLVPESGPHLIFVTMFAKGMIPFSVLLASSVVQDGHGMLPMPAHSRRDFLLVKAINFGAGLLLGAAAMGLGL